MRTLHDIQANNNIQKKNLIRIKSAVEVMQANFVGDLNKCKVSGEE